jgi:hypothetical protein
VHNNTHKTLLHDVCTTKYVNGDSGSDGVSVLEIQPNAFTQKNGFEIRFVASSRSLSLNNDRKKVRRAR